MSVARSAGPIVLFSALFVSSCARGTGESTAALDVTMRGIGPVSAGMSIADASTALGAPLTFLSVADTFGCNHLRWATAPDGVLIMAESLVVVRVDVRGGTTSTAEGARIGDPTERIVALYGARVTTSPHKYTAGQFLTVAPANPADSAFRIVFETDSGRVTRFRSGRIPQVEYVEGCG